MSQLTKARAAEILQTLRERKVLVLGDVMLDEFVWGDVTRISPEGPVPENGPTVEDMLEAGAIPIGKTTLPEFGWKAIGDSPLYGITRNPWNMRMTSGGSSAAAGTCARSCRWSPS